MARWRPTVACAALLASIAVGCSDERHARVCGLEAAPTQTNISETAGVDASSGVMRSKAKTPSFVIMPAKNAAIGPEAAG